MFTALNQRQHDIGEAEASPGLGLHDHVRHEQFAAMRRRHYLERTGSFRALDATADAALASERPPNILIVSGERGCGKSALVASWAQQYRASHEPSFLLEYYFGAVEADGDHVEAICWIMRRIRDHCGLRDELPTTRDGIEEQFLPWLARVQDEPLVLVLDGLDQTAEPGRSLAWLPEFIPPTTRLIVSAADGPVLERLRSRGWREYRVPPLSGADRSAIARRYVAQDDSRWFQVHRLTQSPMAANPLFLRTGLEEIRTLEDRDGLNERIDYYLAADGVVPLFDRIISRLEGEFGTLRVRDLLGFLWTSRRGLAEQEIILLVKRLQDRTSALLHQLDAHLYSTGGLLWFSHDYLRVAIEKRYFGEQDRKRLLERAYRRQLVRYFSDIAPFDRACDEIPWQLDRLGEFRALRDVVLRPEFFNRLSERDRHVELLRYWLRLHEGFPDMPAMLRESAERLSASSDPAARIFVDRSAGLLHTVSEFAHARSLLQRIQQQQASDDRTTAVDRATTLLRLGDNAMASGSYEEADADYTEGISLLASAEGVDAVDVAEAMLNRSALEYQRHSVDNAAERYEELLAFVQDHSEECRYLLPNVLSLAGAIECGRSQYARAEELFREAVAEAESSFGEVHEMTAECVSNFGAALHNQQRYEDAAPFMQRAASIWEQLLGPAAPNLGLTLINMAGNEECLGHLPAALELYERALAIFEGRLGPDNLSVATTCSHMSDTLMFLGEGTRAVEALARAIRIFESQLGPDHPDTVEIRLDMAGLEKQRGRSKRAIEIIRHELPLLATFPYTSAYKLAYWANTYADCLVDIGSDLTEDEFYSLCKGWLAEAWPRLDA